MFWNADDGPFKKLTSMKLPTDVHVGVVQAVEPGTGLIQIRSDNNTIDNCIWAAGAMSRLIGLNTRFIPEIGTQVVYVKGEPTLIIGASTATGIREMMGEMESMSMLSDPTVDTYKEFPKQKESLEKYRAQSTYPNDLLPGELDMSNAQNVGLQVLTNLCRVQAGSRAIVEAHILNDMVRIISENFKLHSIFGNLEIFNDGRLNAIWRGTSLEHEAHGIPVSKASLVAQGKALDNVMLVDDAKRRDHCLHRFQSYLGFLGDFINIFVQHPEKVTQQSFAPEGSQNPSGQGRFHVNEDGTLLMQSAAEIVLERVCRVSVPIRKKHPDSPDGIKAAMWDLLEEKYLKMWSGWKPNYENIHHTGFRLREYARWLASLHCMERFAQAEDKSKEYEVKGESEAGKSDWTCNSEDKKKAMGSYLDHFDTYSTIRIFRDGSILLWDGYGSCVQMAGGSMWLSAERHLHLEAAGDITMSAGQNIHMMSRNSMEMVAVKGGIKIRAAGWLHALCEKGSLWLKSNAECIRKTIREPEPCPGKTLKDFNEPKPDVKEWSIIIEASEGNILNWAGGQQHIHVDGGEGKRLDEMPGGVGGRSPNPKSDYDTYNLDKPTTSFTVYSKDKVMIAAENTIALKSKRNLVLDFGRNIFIRGNEVLAKVKKAFEIRHVFRATPSVPWDEDGLKDDDKVFEKATGTIDINGNVKIKNGSVTATGAFMSKAAPAGGMKVMKVEEVNTNYASSEQEVQPSTVELSSFDMDYKDFILKDFYRAEPQWGHFTDEWYANSGLVQKDKTPIFRSLTQTFISKDADQLGEEGNFDFWSWASNKPGKGKRVSTQFGPWGTAESWYVANEGTTMHMPKGESAKTLADKKYSQDLDIQKISFKYLKREHKANKRKPFYE